MLLTASELSANFFLSKKISLGDARSYFITTARNDLGVVFATSEAGKMLSVTLVMKNADNYLKAQRWNPFHGKRCAVQRQARLKSASVRSLRPEA